MAEIGYCARPSRLHLRRPARAFVLSHVWCGIIPKGVGALETEMSVNHRLTPLVALQSFSGGGLRLTIKGKLLQRLAT